MRKLLTKFEFATFVVRYQIRVADINGDEQIPDEREEMIEKMNLLFPRSKFDGDKFTEYLESAHRKIRNHPYFLKINFLKSLFN